MLVRLLNYCPAALERARHQMRLKRINRSLFAVWLGLLALAASGIQQNQLAGSVLAAALSESTLQPHDAASSGIQGAIGATAAMPAGCLMEHAAGHTHRGHADCALCGAEMALAAFTLPLVLALVLSPPKVTVRPWPTVIRLVDAAFPPPYDSHAPPSRA